MKRAIVLLGLFLVLTGFAKKPGVPWQDYSKKTMGEAVESGQPTVIYFYAEWCGMCSRMHANTFTDPRVIQAMEPMRKIQVDMTSSQSPENQSLAQKFKIYGFPTFIFFDESGQQRLKISGYQGADSFLRTVEKFKSRYTKLNAAEAKAA